MMSRFKFIVLLLVLTLAGSACARTPFVPPPGEVEATEFMGTKLTPITDQNNNALKGTQYIDRATYRLVVDGLVERPLSLTYDDLQKYPQESKLAVLNCVEGWDFIAKWTGPRIMDILIDAKTKPEARIIILHTQDSLGYSSLDISYLREKAIIMALRLNDVTMPQERGFPFQVVAEGKFGYKWAKWVTRIEVSSNEDFRGYWESAGYSNDGNIN